MRSCSDTDIDPIIWWQVFPPFVSLFVVVTDMVIFSIDSSTGMLYRLLTAPSVFRFFLPDIFEPTLITLAPSSTPPVKSFSSSNSHWSFNKIAWPEVNSASSLKAGWRFLGS